MKKNKIGSLNENINLIGLSKNRNANSFVNANVNLNEKSNTYETLTNKYNNLIKSVFQHDSTQSSYSNGNNDRNKSHLSELSSLKMMKSRDSPTISQKISELKLSFLIKQSNVDFDKSKVNDNNIFKSINTKSIYRIN